ncbi:hypothetical protein ILUMI_03164 [Ignelater luminosus]|uniref:Uncharacterized protein n=1 Tax=Ignelater luminosus TaxID=2038154 RepID=A0A8K0DBH3_IGNLU|nr:hypothetical protein ILUMI_03164 [Ignelater luminosus]
MTPNGKEILMLSGSKMAEILMFWSANSKEGTYGWLNKPIAGMNHLSTSSLQEQIFQEERRPPFQTRFTTGTLERARFQCFDNQGKKIQKCNQALSGSKDNTRPQVGRQVIDYLNAVYLQVMEWPANSPNLKPIKHLWDALKKKLDLNKPNPVFGMHQLKSRHHHGVEKDFGDPRFLLAK